MKQAAQQAAQQQRQQQSQRQAQQPQQRAGQPSAPVQQQAQKGQNGPRPFQAPAGTKVEEKVLGPADQGARFYVSPHGVHVAVVTTAGSRGVVLYDGVEGPRFDEICSVTPEGRTSSASGQLVFSPNGEHYAYCGRLGDQFVAIVDGKEFARTTANPSNSGPFLAWFTSDSKHAMMDVQTGDPGYHRLVFDGKSGPASNGRITPVISPDCTRYAYAVTDPRDNRTRTLVVDGKPAGYLGENLQFSADSRHLFATVRAPAPPGVAAPILLLMDGKPVLKADSVTLHVPPAGNMNVAEIFKRVPPNGPTGVKFLVVDGKTVPGSEIPASVAIQQFVFSPDGKHYACVYGNKTGAGATWVFSDGKKGLNYQDIQQLAFTPDSSKLVYLALTNGKRFIVYGGQESDGVMGVLDPVIAPVGNHVAAIFPSINGSPGKFYLDGKTAPVPGRQAVSVSFSPDGAHYAYNCDGHVVLDGVVQENSAMHGNNEGKVIFSPDSRHVAHFSTKLSTSPWTPGIFIDGKWFAVESGITSGITRMAFTPDSKHLVWALETADYHFRAYIDGKPVFEAARPTQGTELNSVAWWEPAADGTISFLARDESSLKRITVTPSAESNLTALLGGSVQARQ
jgi:WD40 repeat protein